MGDDGESDFFESVLEFFLSFLVVLLRGIVRDALDDVVVFKFPKCVQRGRGYR